MINSYTKVEPWKRKMAFAAVKIKGLVAKLPGFQSSRG